MSAIHSSSLFLLLLAAACVKPEACIRVDKMQAGVNEAVAFSNCSENTNYANWDFGDGITVTGDEVSHAYTQAGTYTVKITAHFYENRKKPDTKTITITVQ